MEVVGEAEGGLGSFDFTRQICRGFFILSFGSGSVVVEVEDMSLDEGVANSDKGAAGADVGDERSDEEPDGGLGGAGG